MDQKYTSEVKEELGKLAPILSGLPKVNPYNLPEGYLEDVEEKIMSQLNLISYETKPSVPDGYFEIVENDILKKSGQLHKASKKSNVISIFKYRNQILSIAAVLTFVLTAWFVFTRIEKPETDLALTTGDTAEYLEYIHDNIGEYDINMLIEQGLIEEEDIVMDELNLDQIEDETTWMDSEIDF